MKPLLLIMILLLSCTKEDPTFQTVRKAYELEGNYSGTRTLVCDSLNMNITVDLQLSIRAKDGEMLYVENNDFVGKAQFNQLTYYYNRFIFDYDPDCPIIHTAQMFGTGHLQNDTIIENGWFILHDKRGAWKSILTRM